MNARSLNFIVVFSSVIVAPLLAERNSPLPDRGDGFLTFYLDNDLFAGTDENYTNGARLTWISGSRDISEASSVQRGLRRLVGDEKGWNFLSGLTGLDTSSKLSYNFGFSLTQLIFTPNDLDALAAPPGERPYAGYLGIGFSLHAKDQDTLNSAELTLGVVGPHAFGEETQDLVHDLRGFEKFDGWDSQVPNEPTLTLSLVQKRRFEFSEFANKLVHFGGDGVTEWGAELGNYRTSAFIGFLGRWGYNVPVAFSDPRLSTTAYSHKPFLKYDESIKGKWSVYGLAGTRLTAVAFDATIDGPLFRDFSTGVHSEPFVAEAYLGLGVRYDAWEFTYVHTFRTKEFEEQENDYQSFGSIAARYRF